LPLDGTNFSIRDRDRQKTDIFCTIIGALYGLTLFILALAFMNASKFFLNQIIIKKATFQQTPITFPVLMGRISIIPLSTFPTSMI
jgi:hypothetical protein